MPDPRRKIVRILLFGAAVSLFAGSCTSVRIGGSGPPEMFSVISGDPKIRFDSPVSVYLRKVDDTRLGIFNNSARVPPGPHELLVDCEFGDAAGPSRFALNVTTVAGVDYRLQPVLGLQAVKASGNRGCTGVEMVETPH